MQSVKSYNYMPLKEGSLLNKEGESISDEYLQATLTPRSV